ncbi:MAG: hypothetical protein Q7S33_05750 [Nanoarchaeota archaeon]|nr:hypothetical protein [Nanoarchaeota archaeon]
MKKRQFNVLYIIFTILIVLIISFLFIYFNQQTKNEESKNICQTNSDCVKVQTTCCPCNMGGKEICATKNEAKEYQKKLENCSTTDLICPAMYGCTIQDCKCSNGICGEINY